MRAHSASRRVHGKSLRVAARFFVPLAAGMNNAMFRPDPPAKKPLGARESDLDRLQSALERADHPRPPSSIPMSQGFDINSYLLELDTGGGLDSLRRTSGSIQSLDLGTPQQPMMQQQFPQIPQPLPGFASLPQQQFLQQVYLFLCSPSHS